MVSYVAFFVSVSVLFSSSMCLGDIKFGLSSYVATLWERGAYSFNNMFSLYYVFFVILVIRGRDCGSDCFRSWSLPTVLLLFRHMYRTIPLLLNPKFQASSHLLWLNRLVCVGPGRKSRRWILSRRWSFFYSKSGIINDVTVLSLL